MRIFLDPGYRNECTIWFNNGNVQTLRDDIVKNCSRIRDYVIYNHYDENGSVTSSHQCVSVYLDVMGIGCAYADVLEKMNVEYNKCTYRNVI